ncbi:hypothetical protein LWC35_11065 [Pseudonocardia kujensis]|uniref:hypothetical protein n=1 Tax=Pseudonocardia kujensis TaxID=1128675 RepID=UPI001E2D8A97|nr:hypothetical protein [Pseudonocardia kujensis]MCE0763440.1 hypothetical protein [Pseudonocardia kujensis]
MTRPDDPRPAQPAGPAGSAAPQAADEPIDAEIVETEETGSAPVPVAPPAPGTPPATGYTDQGVPTLDYVRDKIEGRAATAAGWQELTGDSEAVRTADERFAEREQKAKDRLEEIRRSVGL